MTNDIILLKNEDAIKRSVQNLDDYIEPIQTEIEMVVKNYEPRVNLRDVNVRSYPDNNSLEVSIDYDIIGLAAPSQSIKFVLEPTRL